MLKLVRSKGILVKKMSTLDSFLFFRPPTEDCYHYLGAVPRKNIRGRITNVYVVYEDFNHDIKYYDFPQGKGYKPLKRNAIVFGSPGSGKCHHPWDNLKPCLCGCRENPLLMYEKNKLYYCSGKTENVFAVCSVCGRHTAQSDIVTTIRNWNNDIITEEQRI